MFDSSRPARWNMYVAAAGLFMLVMIYVGTSGPSFSGVRNLAEKLALPEEPAPIPYDPEIPDDAPGTMYGDFHEFFQDDLPNENPNFHAHKLRTYMPHNWQGCGQRTFATVLSTRRGSMHDPYFLAAQQLVYRMLWDPRSKSEYPFTVFVAPFIHDDQRNLLAAAGAIVRELPLIQWNATDVLVNGRWRDLFIKLNIWAQTDFDRVVLLDTDAFPIENLDGIFDELDEQECDRDKLEDFEDIDEVCEYAFAAVEHQAGNFNAGVLVAQPNAAMHARLLRHMASEEFMSSTMEQSFLNQFFRQDGPFPAQYIDRQWNGFVPLESEEGKLKVFHDKLWTIDKWQDRNLTWAKTWFNDTWDDMLRLYESDEFEEMRKADGVRLY